jgi:hypothetical protein
MKKVSACAVASLVAGCAQSATIPLQTDVIQITTSAAPVCGATGAQYIALRQAAVETIRRGFDKFIIVGGQYQNDVRVVGHTPVTAHTTGTATTSGFGNVAVTQGQSTTTYSGGYPIIAGKHNQALIVRLYKADDPMGAKAISARQVLGPKWKEIVKSDPLTCLGE